MPEDFKTYEDAMNKLNKSDETSRAVPKYYEDPLEGERLVDALIRVTSKVPNSATREEKMALSNYLLEEWFILPLMARTKRELMADPHYQFILVQNKQWELANGFKPSVFTVPELQTRCGLFHKRNKDGSVSETEFEVYTWLIDTNHKVTKVFAGWEELYTVYYPTERFWMCMDNGLPCSKEEAEYLFYLDDKKDEYQLARARVIERLSIALKKVLPDPIWIDFLIRGEIQHMEAMNSGQSAFNDFQFKDKKGRLHAVRFKQDGFTLETELIKDSNSGHEFSLDQKTKEINKALLEVAPSCKALLEDAAKGVTGNDLCNR